MLQHIFTELQSIASLLHTNTPITYLSLVKALRNIYQHIKGLF